jgi:hypothetical protein
VTDRAADAAAADADINPLLAAVHLTRMNFEPSLLGHGWVRATDGLAQLDDTSISTPHTGRTGTLRRAA